ncbi:glutamate formimidoyltransferase [Thermosediminibacter litoriperuensis]|uniref:glutamate formimidoyltransferase n=1 Tax=Thermosediminibacter litoriperuensis TaxID=291989 RepID=A0A5S5AMM8_9FIRM|nr:glutamate formimidoyltransferase [Thermosediminibacter litoriperuensis]TYP52432.1 glutamate formiminotransferase [Thermosediminibacter litoriperuensis]
MKKIVECVPNISEGRRTEVIETIVDEVRKVEGVKLLDVNPDESHNRTVITFVGEPEAVKKAAFALCAKAAELIDMEKHKGEHPRIGATDVIPFIPVSNVTMEECVELANELGQEIAEKLGIPVYMYEEAAKIPERKSLPNIRKGEYEGLKQEITKPERRPDYGPPRMHLTAGATVVGARQFLIAYNINLDTDDVKIAKKIANSIREAKGGYKYVRAMGVMIEGRNVAQVTINMLNYTGTPLFRVFETVKSEAARYGVNVIGSEIVGLVPVQALLDVADFYLRLENFDRKQVLELNI